MSDYDDSVRSPDEERRIRRMAERRNAERAPPPLNTAMTEGTLVVVRRDDGSGLVTKTRSLPWRLGHGDWVVSVEGISGGYALERVTPILGADAAAATPADPRAAKCVALHDELVGALRKRVERHDKSERESTGDAEAKCWCDDCEESRAVLSKAAAMAKEGE